MAPSSLLELLKNGAVLFDGAMGNLLHGQGANLDRCFDELNLICPDMVVDAHRAYIQSGVQVIETNTFGANRLKLSEHGLDDRVAEINHAGVELAQRVADEVRRADGPAAPPVLVAGSVGPSGRQMAPLGRLRPEIARAVFLEQVKALVSAGVDLLIFETFSDLDEMGESWWVYCPCTECGTLNSCTTKSLVSSSPTPPANGCDARARMARAKAYAWHASYWRS